MKDRKIQTQISHCEERLKTLQTSLTAVEDKLFLLKPYLDTQEAAVYLGISVSYLHKLTMQRAIPFYSPVGRRLYFKREELDEWIGHERHASSEEMQSVAARTSAKNIYKKRYKPYNKK